MKSIGLSKYLEQHTYLTNNDINHFKNHFKPESLKKGDLFVEEGKVSEQIAFIEQGIFRSFYYTSGLEQVTYCFTFPNTLITAYSSWISQKPSKENIEALTEMDLLVINKEDLEYLFNTNPIYIKLFKDIAEQEYINLEDRIFMLQKESAEVRYANLLKNNPEYLLSIPLKYIASYLGVTMRHLSRIRKSITF